MAQRISSGTWLVIGLLAFAILIAAGRAVLKRVGDKYPVTVPAVPAVR